MSGPGIIELHPNQPEARPYLGGSGIARFRGHPHEDRYRPEDFLGSTTEVFAGGGIGLTTLPNGQILRDAIASDPVAYLGPLADASIAGDSGLLTKLLSTDERLFIHSHPSDEFAQENDLGSRGKTESWFILDVAEGVEAYVLLGFTRTVSAQELATWFETQAVSEMVATMHRIPVAPGDTFHVPAGVPHGIGPGITLVELQQPTDLSILLEYSDYPALSREHALLTLPRDVALSAIRRERVTGAELEALQGDRAQRGRQQQLFPAEADRFYKAVRVHPGDVPEQIGAAFSVIVVRGGHGELTTAAGTTRAASGQVFLVRHDAGAVTISPELDVIVCQPAGAEQ